MLEIFHDLGLLLEIEVGYRSCGRLDTLDEYNRKPREWEDMRSAYHCHCRTLAVFATDRQGKDDYLVDLQV